MQGRLKEGSRGYRELEGFTGGYKWLQGVQGITGDDKGLLRVIRGYRGLQGMTGVTRDYSFLLGVTRDYTGLQEVGAGY